MATAVFGWDATDDGAPARRMAARDRHLAVITAWARDGRLALGTPLFRDDGRVLGSLMLLADGVDPAEYLAAEPFNAGEVWARTEALPFRIAPLPYRRLPQPGAPLPAARTHTVIVTRDGTDAGALERRLKVREAHMARVRPMAADGTPACGGAILEGERMVGSIAIVARATDAEARAWMAEDPYMTGGVWQDVTLYGTRFAPLPYRALPGGE